MEVYVTEKYFDIFESLLVKAAKDILSNTPTNINCIFQLLSSLPLKVNISDTEREKYQAILGNKQYTTFKDRIISYAIKNQRLYNDEYDYTSINNFNAYYFLDIDDTENPGLKNGIVVKDKTFDGTDFYADCTVTHQEIAGDFNLLVNNIPPTNAMLIIDKYIFGHPFVTKLERLISFLNLYKKQELSIPFHLTILCSYQNGRQTVCTPAQIQAAFERLSEIENLYFQIIIDDNIPQDDRLIFTNYTKGNIGHPFDNRETVFNQKFLGFENSAEKITKNYKVFVDNLKKWKTFINGVPKQMGAITMKYANNEFINRLFEFID
jgi:hypothetical protein